MLSWQVSHTPPQILIKSHISYSRGALLAGLTSSQCPNMSSENTALLKSHIHIIVTPNLFDLFLLLQKTHSQAIIYLDVVKSRVQADDPSKPLYRGTLDCVRQSYKRLVDRSPNSTGFVLDFFKDNRTIIRFWISIRTIVQSSAAPFAPGKLLQTMYEESSHQQSLSFFSTKTQGLTN